MKPIFRLCQIKFILLRYGLDELLTKLPKRRWLRGLAYLNPYHYCPSNKRNSIGVRLRLALTALGPIFVKFGQVLSTRRDLLPAVIADELALLQDRVPPFSGAEAQALLEKAYGRKIDSVFRSFDVKPLASASIAQVHAATLLDGTEVVVKIVRPNLATAIKRDIALLYWLATWMERLWPTGKRLRLKNVVAEFERCTWHELDLLREAASASQLRRNFADSTQLYIPAVYWSYTHKEVLVIERIHGIPIGNTAALRAAYIDLKKLAEHCVKVFFTQVFQHCFFHADMHPGNLFVSAHDPLNPQLIAVDFGIMGSLSPHDQRYLAENFLAFFKRDYRRVAQLHIESGWIPATTRLEEFEAAVRSVCEPVFERPLKDISCGQLLLQLFQTAEQFKMVLQPQLVLLQKTLLNVEGLSRQLYPDLDLWHTAKPVLTKWLKQQLGPRAFLRKIRENAPFWAEKLPELPELIHNALRQVSIDKTALQPEQPTHLRRIKQHAFYQGVCVTVLCLAVVIGFTWFWLNL